MFLSTLGILDILAGVIGLVAINYGYFKDIAYVLLVIVMLKGIWSVMAGLNG